MCVGPHVYVCLCMDQKVTFLLKSSCWTSSRRAGLLVLGGWLVVFPVVPVAPISRSSASCGLCSAPSSCMAASDFEGGQGGPLNLIVVIQSAKDLKHTGTDIHGNGTDNGNGKADIRLIGRRSFRTSLFPTSAHALGFQAVLEGSYYER